jgi:hypothetical protein
MRPMIASHIAFVLVIWAAVSPASGPLVSSSFLKVVAQVFRESSPGGMKSAISYLSLSNCAPRPGAEKQLRLGVGTRLWGKRGFRSLLDETLAARAAKAEAQNYSAAARPVRIQPKPFGPPRRSKSPPPLRLHFPPSLEAERPRLHRHSTRTQACLRSRRRAQLKRHRARPRQELSHPPLDAVRPAVPISSRGSAPRHRAWMPRRSDMPRPAAAGPPPRSSMAAPSPSGPEEFRDLAPIPGFRTEFGDLGANCRDSKTDPPMPHVTLPAALNTISAGRSS